MLQIVLRRDEIGDISQRALKAFDFDESMLVFSRCTTSILESADDFSGEI
jgi:hypothetical protein